MDAAWNGDGVPICRQHSVLWQRVEMHLYEEPVLSRQEIKVKFTLDKEWADQWRRKG